MDETVWQRRLEREKRARAEAEKLLEDKSYELWELNQSLEKKVQEKTAELEHFNARLKEMVNQEVEKNRQKDKMIVAQSRLAAMGEMIGMIAHQWRQPITAVGSVCNNILMDIDLEELDDQALHKDINLVLEQTQFLSSTIDDFRNFFKQDKELVKVHINDLIEKSLLMMKGAFKNNNITVLKEFQSQKEFLTYANELTQVVLNLVKNAKDIFEDKPIEGACIKIYTKDTNDGVIIAVRDNAGGIPESIIERIFEPYFSTKKEKNGTGLGLYMSKTIVEEHLDGKLRAYNKGPGAVFEVLIKEKK